MAYLPPRPPTAPPGYNASGNCNPGEYNGEEYYIPSLCNQPGSSDALYFEEYYCISPGNLNDQFQKGLCQVGSILWTFPFVRGLCNQPGSAGAIYTEGTCLQPGEASQRAD